MRLKQAIYYLLKKINLIFKKIMVTDSASGSIASFPDGSDLLPAISLVANIVPKQSGTGTPSPENVREISGWTEVDIKQCASLLRPSAPKTEVINGITFQSFGDGSYRVSGTSTAVAFCTVMPFESFEFPSDASYSIYLHNTVATADVSVYFANDNTWIDFWNCSSVNRVISLPQATLTGKSCNGIRIRVKENATVDMTIAPMISKVPTTHTTSLGRTVYGGSVDVVSGVLNVTHALVDLGTLNWRYLGDGQSYARFNTSSIADTVKKPSSNSIPTTAICENYSAVGASSVSIVNNSFGVYTDGDLAIKDDAITTVEDFISAVNGVMLVYPLATPQTYQLTPQTINTLQGVNNVWVDSGDCSIEYVRDIGLALDNLLPDSPTTDGTYTLVCTVSDGKATIAWQSSEASLSSPLSMSSPASLNINTTEGE